MYAVIGLVIVLSVVAVWGVYRALSRMASSLETPAPVESQQGPWLDGLQVGAEGLAYLFAHKFVTPVVAERISPRNRVAAPLTGETIDARRWVEFIIYAFVAENYLNERIELDVVETAPTFMPPLPHKPWSLQVRLRDALPLSPLGRAAGEAFAESKGVAPALTLDDLLDKTARLLRRNVKFWKRTGLCEQLLQHIQAAMAHLGYVRATTGDTVLERLRDPVFEVVEEEAAPLEQEADALRDRLAEFERWHSLPPGPEDEMQEALPGGVDARLATSPASEAGQWMADCLRLSVYEAVTCLRQLEPSDEFLR